MSDENKNLEKATVETVSDTDGDTEIVDEVQEEPEEDNPQKQYQVALKQSVASARIFIGKIKEERIVNELGKASEEPGGRPEPKTLPDLEKLVADKRKQKKTFGAMVKQKFRSYALSREGVADTEAVSVLIEYLESNITDTDYRILKVPKESAKDKKKELSESGFIITRDYADWSDKSKVRIEFTKKVPYRLKKGEAVKLEKLIGKANDPMATIELLKNLGFGIDGHTFRYKIAELQDVVAMPGMNEALVKICALGLKPRSTYFSRNEDKSSPSKADAVKDIEDLVADKELMTALNPQTTAKIRSLIQKYDLEPELEKKSLKLLLEVATNPRAEALIDAIMQGVYSFSSKIFTTHI